MSPTGKLRRTSGAPNTACPRAVRRKHGRLLLASRLAPFHQTQRDESDHHGIRHPDALISEPESQQTLLPAGKVSRRRAISMGMGQV